jgi:D-glycero-D-manno-heptose 1,7-bisphosphate phosphatase
MRLPRLDQLRAIIFDRDGTLNASGPADNGGYILDPAQLQLLPGVREELVRLHERGVLMFVFSQQNCVSKGLISESGVDAVHAKMNADLSPASIKSFYFNTQACAGRDWSKPGPGMLNAILTAHPELNASNTLVVGDAVRDAESADAAGLPFAFVASDQPSKTEEARKTGRPLFDNLNSLIKSLK